MAMGTKREEGSSHVLAMCLTCSRTTIRCKECGKPKRKKDYSQYDWRHHQKRSNASHADSSWRESHLIEVRPHTGLGRSPTSRDIRMRAFEGLIMMHRRDFGPRPRAGCLSCSVLEPPWASRVMVGWGRKEW